MGNPQCADVDDGRGPAAHDLGSNIVTFALEPARVVHGSEGASGDEEGSTTSLGKALAVLETLASNPYGVMGVSEVAREIRVPKSTAHRLLKTLEGYSFIERSGTKYLLGSRFLELSYSARWSDYGQLREGAQPGIEALFERVQETINLAVLDRGEVLYLDKITGRGGTLVPSRIGSRLPATCTAIGKAMLAFTPHDTLSRILSTPPVRRTRYTITSPAMLGSQIRRARQERIAFEAEESKVGIVCVASPILSGSGQLLGAVSVAGPSFRFKTAPAAEAVLDAARGIAQDLQACSWKSTR